MRACTIWLPVLIAMVSASSSRIANASCAAPDPKIAWTYPADGATEIPTNAVIWLLLANWHQPAEVALNGARVPVAEIPFLYRPADLQPRTHYEVRLIATPTYVPTPVEVTWGFTTGDGPSPLVAPAPPVIERVSKTQVRDFDALCAAVWWDCYDTGQNTHVLFHDAGPVPLLWMVEHVGQVPQAPSLRLWPGVCGTPETYVTASVAEGCFSNYRLHAGDATGLTAASQPVCPTPTPTPTTPGGAAGDRGGGCTILGLAAGQGRTAPAIVFAVLVLSAAVRVRGRF